MVVTRYLMQSALFRVAATAFVICSGGSIISGCGEERNAEVAAKDAEVAAAGPTADGVPSVTSHLPAYDDPIVQEWARYNSECRDRPLTEGAASCQQRERLTPLVEARGWCYAREPGGVYDWLHCSEASAYEAEVDSQSQTYPGASSEPMAPSRRSWFIASTRGCPSLNGAFGVETPEEVVSLFSANGIPLRFRRKDDEMVLVQDARNANDPGMAFVHGEEECLSVAAFLGAGG